MSNPYFHRVQKAFQHGKADQTVKPEPVASRPDFAADANIEITFRAMTIDDAAFVLDSWCSSYRHSPHVGPVDDAVFKIEQRARVYRLVPKSKVLLAVDPKDQTRIRGWICFEPPRESNGLPIVHYVLVRPELQSRGIGTALVDLAKRTAKDPAGPIWTTHETYPMKRLRAKWGAMYNNYLLDYVGGPAKKPVVGGNGIP